MERIHAIYDGEVLRPENGTQLETNARYLLIVEKDESNGQGDPNAAYPLTVIQNLAIDMGVKDLAENHDRYAKVDCMDTLDQRLQKAYRLTEITEQVGFALWQLQELESVAAQYFVIVAQAAKGMGLTAGNTLVEKAQSKTFGATVRQLTKAGLVSFVLELRFNNLLSERNWLVHKSRANSRNAVHSDTAKQQLVLRLKTIAEESLALLREISLLTEQYVKERGVSEQYISETANRLLEEWHKADAV